MIILHNILIVTYSYGADGLFKINETVLNIRKLQIIVIRKIIII